jgi:hypothetical protein
MSMYNIIMLNAVRMDIIMLNVFRINDFLLNVVAPEGEEPSFFL